jgi:four helix bundle protein
MGLDHEKLDVYAVALDFAAWAYDLCRTLKGMDRPTRNQLLRASQSIALNIAEGCGKMPPADRGRFLRIAGGSARECGAILDILNRCGTLDGEAVRKGKDLLVRIVAMLTRMIERGNQVREGDVVYVYGNEERTGQQKPAGSDDLQ